MSDHNNEIFDYTNEPRNIKIPKTRKKLTDENARLRAELDEAIRVIDHVTGASGKTDEHYWPKACVTCAKAAAFLERMKSKETK
jgi:hypothetical protein